jgi:hypothetical protein
LESANRGQGETFIKTSWLMMAEVWHLISNAVAEEKTTPALTSRPEMQSSCDLVKEEEDGT